MSRTKVGIYMPTLANDLQRIPDYARWADEAEFDSLWDYEMYRNAFTMLTAAALSTQRVALGTGIATALTRSPFVTANAIADIDDFSNGRAILGLAAGGPELLENFHSSNADKSVGKLSEYIDVIRVAWDHLNTGEPASFEGKHFRFQSLSANPFGFRKLTRERVPIYLASMGPMIAKVAGKKADGWIGSLLATPRFIDREIRPHLEEGAKRSGRDVSEIQKVVMVVCSVSGDRDEAIRRAKVQAGLYLAHPVSTGAAILNGLEVEQRAIQHGAMAGRPLEEVVDDKVVETLTITGTPEEARQKLEAWHEAAPDVHIVLETPMFPPITAEDSEDCYRNIIAALGKKSLENLAEGSR